MLKILLYMAATCMETALGIWIFGKMFPKRAFMEKKHYLTEGLLFTFIIVGVYSFPKTFYTIYNKEMYILILGIVYCVTLLVYIVFIMRRQSAIFVRFVNDFLFVLMVVWLGCQYWLSYQSPIMLILGNILPVLFLFVFYQCNFIEAYLWEILYLVNIGMLKAIFITYSGVFENKHFEEFVYYPRSHSYSETIYLIFIYLVIAFLIRYIPVFSIIKKILTTNRTKLFMAILGEWIIFIVLMDTGKGKIDVKNLTFTLIIVIGMMLGLLVLYIKAISKTKDAEKKILDVRNETLESQYIELLEFPQICPQNPESIGIVINNFQKMSKI